MKPAIKKRWLSALRSGKYKQGKGDLKIATPRGKEKFCCLGVLCDLYIEEHKTVDWNPCNGIGSEGGLLPNRVQKWAGIKSDDPIVVVNQDREDSLSTLNDGSGFGFKRIARLIEEQL